MKHTITQILMGLLVLSFGACNLFKSDADGDTANAEADSGKVNAPADELSVGEGLSQEEAKAVMREENVKAGTGIGEADLKTELDMLEEEINADIEGREPSLKPGATPKAPPLVAKETFTPENASSDLEYDRDMAVMNVIRAHINKKKAAESEKKAAAPSSSPEE